MTYEQLMRLADEYASLRAANAVLLTGGVLENEYIASRQAVEHARNALSVALKELTDLAQPHSPHSTE